MKPAPARSSIDQIREQAELLTDVQAGRVARHRLGRNRSPAFGQDFQEVPGRGPGGLRKAAARLTLLRQCGLVRLPDGDPAAESWPWELTPTGTEYLEHIQEELHATAATEREAC
jgi:hypothetical protein